MKAVLIGIFLFLFVMNKQICTWFYPYDPGDANTYHYFQDWYFMRDRIYELMFLIAISWPFAKGTRLSRAIVAGGFVVILSSVSDKLFMNQFTTMLRDWMVVVPAAVMIAYFVYMKGKPK